MNASFYANIPLLDEELLDDDLKYLETDIEADIGGWGLDELTQDE